MPRILKKAPPLEKQEDHFCQQLWEAAGMTVISFSQAQRAQQTRGIADQLVIDPKTGTFWWFEVKRQEGPEFLAKTHDQTIHQVLFQKIVEGVGMEYLIGSRREVEKRLREMGRLM